MEIVSVLNRNNMAFDFYNTEKFLHYIKEKKPGRLFITISDGSEARRIISGIMEDHDLSGKVMDISPGGEEVERAEEEYRILSFSSSELLAKNKMIEMFTDTIYSYFHGIWKDFDSLNSPETSAVFRARYLLISSVTPEYVSKYYFPILHGILERLRSREPEPDDILISDIEWSFWFTDNIMRMEKNRRLS